MCHRCWSPLFIKVSTKIPISISQVCLKPNWILTHTVFPCLLPPFSPVEVIEVIDLVSCNISLDQSNASLHLLWGIAILRIVLSVMLLVLALVSTLKQSVVLYKATKKWQPNHYMQLFVKDGIFYFLVYVFPLPFLSVPFITIRFSHPCYSQLPPPKKANHCGLLG